MTGVTRNPLNGARAVLPAVLAALAIAIVPAGAGAVTFGADLTVAPNVAFDCTLTPPVAGFQVGSGATTCTWWTTGRLTDTSQGHVVPYGGGTITAARVRVGPITGPMQFVVMRSLRHPASLADPACCFPVGASEIFTPTANAVTQVPMNVAVRNDTDPASGINNYDHIAISVLSPGVPIPAFYTGDQSVNGPVGGGFYPAYVPGTERTTGMFGVVGFQTLISADLDPTPVPTPLVPTLPAKAVTLGRRPGRVRAGRALIPLVCGLSAEACAGVLELQRRGVTVARAGASGRTTTYGKVRFKIAAGKTGRLKVKLNKAGRRLLRRGKGARVYANVTVASKRVLSERVTLRR